MSVHEYELEPIPGLPGIPPAGEKILWQGSPEWRSFLVHVLHARWVLAYFGALTAWRFYASVSDGLSLPAAITSSLWLMPMWLTVIAALVGYAVAASRTTIYTLTNKRLIIRFGVALPMCVNVPFTKVIGADLKMFGDGTGQLPLELDGDVRLAYLVIWPHVRPGAYLNPRPMLRSIPNPQAVAKLLAEVLALTQPGVAGELVPSKPFIGSRPLKPITTAAGPGFAPAAAE